MKTKLAKLAKPITIKSLQRSLRKDQSLIAWTTGLGKAGFLRTFSSQRHPDCEDCQNKGWLLFSDHTIQRCDQCQRYDGDLEAALAFFRSPESRNYHLQDIVIKQKLPAKGGKR